MKKLPNKASKRPRSPKRQKKNGEQKKKTRASKTRLFPEQKTFFYFVVSSSLVRLQKSSHSHHLVLANDGELKDDVLASELAVDLAEGVDLVVDAGALLGVKEDLDDLVAVLLGADALANDLSGVDEVGEDSVVDSGQGAGSWALLGDTAAARGEREDTALGDEEDVAVRELLLELTGESVVSS